MYLRGTQANDRKRLYDVSKKALKRLSMIFPQCFCIGFSRLHLLAAATVVVVVAATAADVVVNFITIILLLLTYAFSIVVALTLV